MFHSNSGQRWNKMEELLEFKSFNERALLKETDFSKYMKIQRTIREVCAFSSKMLNHESQAFLSGELEVLSAFIRDGDHEINLRCANDTVLIESAEGCESWKGKEIETDRTNKNCKKDKNI